MHKLQQTFYLLSSLVKELFTYFNSLYINLHQLLSHSWVSYTDMSANLASYSADGLTTFSFIT